MCDILLFEYLTLTLLTFQLPFFGTVHYQFSGICQDKTLKLASKMVRPDVCAGWPGSILVQQDKF